MNVCRVLVACAFATTALGAASADAASVTVVYANPDKFTDAGSYRGPSRERDRTLKDLADYLQTLGGKHLKPDETLKIEALDLDLAGRVEPWRMENTDIRIMRGIDWPSMTVRYTLTRNEAIISEGEDRITDLNYLMNPALSTSANDSLRFEKHMLADWFNKHFRRTDS
ncbi:MAG: DUF3016 domain-containing protein [Rhodospirillaceae bacterium]